VVAQGEIWLLETPNEKARPVLVVTRNEAIPALRAVVVAPLTSTIRRIPTNLAVGRGEGVDRDSVATFDSLAAVPMSALTVRLGALSAQRRHELCAALDALANC
jgi:mRNA interferase MazF